MKFGFRVPSLKKRISARTSLKRYVRHSMNIKTPKGLGFITSPKKALYNKVYKKTTFGIEDLGKPSLGKMDEKTSPINARSLTDDQNDNTPSFCPRTFLNLINSHDSIGKDSVSKLIIVFG